MNVEALRTIISEGAFSAEMKTELEGCLPALAQALDYAAPIAPAPLTLCCAIPGHCIILSADGWPWISDEVRAGFKPVEVAAEIMKAVGSQRTDIILNGLTIFSGSMQIAEHVESCARTAELGQTPIVVAFLAQVQSEISLSISSMGLPVPVRH